MTVRPPFRDASHVVSRLGRTHASVSVTPQADPSLRYVLPIPRGWSRVWSSEAPAAEGRPGVIGQFAPCPDLDGSRIVVSVTRLRWDVDPVLWVMHDWRAAGWEIAVAGPLHPRWHPRFEVGAVRRSSGGIEIRRTVGFIDGGRLLRVDTTASAGAWERLHDLVWPCGAMMSLARPTYRREVEAAVRHESPPVAFELPASWEAKPIAPAWAGAVRWAVQPVDGSERSVAMRIDATPWPPERFESAAVRQERVRHELAAQGIAMSRRVARLPSGSALGVSGLGGFYLTDARVRGDDFEVRFAHRDLESWSVDYTVIAAASSRCALDHMRAVRAMELAVATTRIVHEERTHAA